MTLADTEKPVPVAAVLYFRLGDSDEFVELGACEIDIDVSLDGPTRIPPAAIADALDDAAAEFRKAAEAGG